MPQSVEELEAQRQVAEQQAKEEIEAAGEEAREEAESQGLSEDDVQRRVQEARKQEKDKLYPKIEELTNIVKQQQEFIRTQQEKEEEEERKRSEKAEKARLSKLSEEDRVQEKFNKLEEQLKEEREARLESEEENRKIRRKQELKEYRQRVLQAATKPLVIEMVGGNSEEEIDKSIVTATARYEEIEKEARERLGQQVKQGLSTSTSPDTEALEEEELEERITQVDTDKYMADPDYREKIKAQLEQSYQRAWGR